MFKKFKLFIYKKYFLLFLIINTSLQATTYSERRAARNQADFATMVNSKLNQIEHRYSAEIAALKAGDFDDAKPIILNKAQSDYWFFAINRYNSAITNYTHTLTKFKNGKILSNHKLLANNPVLTQTLERINRVQSNLQHIIIGLTLEDIEQTYAIEFKITNLNNEALLAKTIFNKINQNWFKSLVRYRLSIQSHIERLNNLQMSEINNNQLAWNTDTKLMQTLLRFKLAQNNLQIIDNFIRQDPAFINAMQWAKFWTITASVILITLTLAIGIFAGYIVIEALFWPTRYRGIAGALAVLFGTPTSITALSIGIGEIIMAKKAVKKLNN